MHVRTSEFKVYLLIKCYLYHMGNLVCLLNTQNDHTEVFNGHPLS